MDTTTEVSGLDLKLERVAARLKAVQVAAEMGISSSRISTIEREAVVSDAIVLRYRDAIRTCGIRRSGREAA